MNKTVLCLECGNEMNDTKIPNEWLISIPFTRIEIRIWRWVDEKVCMFCSTPERDNYDMMIEDAYNEGHDDGYGEVYEKYTESN